VGRVPLSIVEPMSPRRPHDIGVRPEPIGVHPERPKPPGAPSPPPRS
jgi:hypothetical protein